MKSGALYCEKGKPCRSLLHGTSPMIHGYQAMIVERFWAWCAWNHGCIKDTAWMFIQDCSPRANTIWLSFYCLLTFTLLLYFYQPMPAFLCSKSIQVTRVDVSEAFSADQLWFRILSGLFQRCSLPENLWTALIQLWNRADSELNSADFLWNSSETGNFQSKKISAETELFQRWFSLKQSWTALIFSDTALKNQKSRARKISSESVLFQRWFSLKESWYPLKPS